jgi:lysozyme family protein
MVDASFAYAINHQGDYNMDDPVFVAALKATLKHEGGYVNNPADPGGETNFGITKGTALASGYSGSMADISDDIVQAIYFKEYYAGPGFDKIAKFAPALASYLFDIGVNTGPATAVKYLQTAISIVGPLEVVVDGKLGPKTINVLWNLAPNRRDAVFRVVGLLHGTHYLNIVKNRPDQKQFLVGWLKRCR